MARSNASINSFSLTGVAPRSSPWTTTSAKRPVLNALEGDICVSDIFCSDRLERCILKLWRILIQTS